MPILIASDFHAANVMDPQQKRQSCVSRYRLQMGGCLQ